MKPEPRKKINVEQVVKYLSHAFSKAQQKAFPQIGNKNARGTALHRFQVDFCYLIDHIERGPAYIAPKKISEANELIEALSTYTAE